jgi:hypothetical protein
VDWIGLAQGGDKWRALVNAVMRLGIFSQGASVTSYS